MSLWEDYEPTSFEVEGFPKVRFPAIMLGEDGSNRIARRRRPYRAGWKLDTTGNDGDMIPFEAKFYNEIVEPGTTDDDGPRLYPDRLDLLIELFKTAKTGTLNTPWKRGLRVKVDNWSRREFAEGERDGAVLTGNFITDNEDNIDREAIVRPSPRSTLTRQVEATTFDAESTASWVTSLADLREFSSNLVALINAPNEYRGQIKGAAAVLVGAVFDIRNALSTTTEGRNQMNDPDSANLRVRLLEIEDLAAQAEWEAKKRREATTLHFPERDTDIWSIATELKQDSAVLQDLNEGDFEDFANIPSGVGVRVLQQ